MNKIEPGANLLHEIPASSSTRIGLVTNASGLTSQGVPTWKALISSGYKLTALFGPEHGFRGEAQDAVHVQDASFKGIPVYSLYGIRERPTQELFKNTDLILYDIQDIGCRYYTYIYTLAYIMEACEKFGIPLVVLDRPNPIGNNIVEGSPIAAEFDNFVGGYGLAPRYGMTVGEMACYLKGEYYKNTELSVIWMKNYKPESYYDELKLPWPLPSPNLPSINAAILYPGTCLFEGTNLSEGRGTTRPFEITGAPWIDGEELRERLASFNLPGVTFSSVFFTPTFSKFKGIQCEGVLTHITDRSKVESLRTGITILEETRKMNKEKFEWRSLWENNKGFFIDNLAGGPNFRKIMDSGASADDITKYFTSGRQEFESVRRKYIHY